MTAPMPATSDLAPLMKAIAAGDRSALAELYRRTSAKMYGISLRILKSESDAEEVLQDVFVTVWRKAAMFDASRASPISWMAVLTRNRAIDRLRRRTLPSEGIEAANDIAADDPSALDLLELAEDRTRLHDCLDELEEDKRVLVRAAFLDGATYAELAERGAVPLGTMKSWIRRSLQRLKGCLER